MIPYILTGFSVALAFILHWQYPTRFWLANAYTTIGTVVVSLWVIFLLQSSFLGFDVSDGDKVGLSMAMWLSVLLAFFGFLVGAFVGYFLKMVREPQ